MKKLPELKPNSLSSVVRLILHESNGTMMLSDLMTKTMDLAKVTWKQARNITAFMKNQKELTWRVTGRALRSDQDHAMAVDGPVKLTAKGIAVVQRLVEQGVTLAAIVKEGITFRSGPDARSRVGSKRRTRTSLEAAANAPLEIHKPLEPTPRKVHAEIGAPPDATGILKIGDKIAYFVGGKRRDFTRGEWFETADFFRMFFEPPRAT